jgi:hypothetical protein
MIEISDHHFVVLRIWRRSLSSDLILQIHRQRNPFIFFPHSALSPKGIGTGLWNSLLHSHSSGRERPALALSWSRFNGGALLSHLIVLGIQVRDDGGQLFIYALLVFISSSTAFVYRTSY